MRTTTAWMWRVGGAIAVFWMVGVVMISPLMSPNIRGDDDEISNRLQKAIGEVDQLKKQNEDIKSVLKEFSKHIDTLSGANDNRVGRDSELANALKAKLDDAQQMLKQSGNVHQNEGFAEYIPSREYEETRRMVNRGIQETWWYLSSQLQTLAKKVDGQISPSEQIETMLKEGANRVRVAQFDLERLSNVDGLGAWREKEAEELSLLIQQRLESLQNPQNCPRARKLVCNLNKGCGYGCQIHHAAYCLIVAYGTKRTLILKSKGWRYNKAGWEDVFRPLSETCTDPSGVNHAPWPGKRNTQVVDLPIVDSLVKRPQFLPLSIPDEFADRIIRLSGNPSAWWVGQILKYLLKPQDKTQKMLDDMKSNMGFQGPIVGVHVRRTDKVGTEAAFHPLEEYMSHVEEYFKKIELKAMHEGRTKTPEPVIRRVYLASDDPTVITEARERFPNYIFLADPKIAKIAAVATRYTDESLKGIIADIHFLSLTDYLVCTFSSQVSRIAFEIMQAYNPDASYNFRSLDDVYYYGGQSAHDLRARFPHTANGPSEMNLQIGDEVSLAGNHWDGFSKGTNRRTNKNALYPSYLMEEIIVRASMASYSTENR